MSTSRPATLALLLGAAVLGLALKASAADNAVVVWYTSVDTRALALIVDHFEQTHPGMSLQTLRLGAPQIPPRILVEQAAHSPKADVVSGDLLAINQLAEAGALQPYHTHDAGRFVKGTVDPRGFGAALYLTTIVIAWNPTKTKADGLTPPASLADLTKPEWKGKLGVTASGFNWYAGVMATQRDGQALTQKLADNHPLIASGYSNLTAQLEAGEVDATPTAYGYQTQTEKDRGQSIDYVLPATQIIDPAPIALVKDAPHLAAAKIFMDWALSKDGQAFIKASSDRTSARTDVPNDPRVFDPNRPYYVLPAPGRVDYDRLIKAYNTLFAITG